MPWNLVRWLPAIGQAVAIFALSAQPDLRVARDPLLDLVLRKAAHLTVFAMLAVFVAYGSSPHMGRREVVIGALLAAGLYAITDEVHQGFVIGRTASPVDVIVDWIGAGLGVAGWWVLGRRARGDRSG